MFLKCVRSANAVSDFESHGTSALVGATATTRSSYLSVTNRSQNNLLIRADSAQSKPVYVFSSCIPIVCANVVASLRWNHAVLCLSKPKKHPKTKNEVITALAEGFSM